MTLVLQALWAVHSGPSGAPSASPQVPSNPGPRWGHRRTIPLRKPAASVKPSAWNVFDHSVPQVSYYVGKNDDYGEFDSDAIFPY